MAVSQTNSKPIYLYTGPEFGQRDDAVQSVIKAHKKKCGDIDEHLFYLQETPMNEIMSILQNGTLFSNGVSIVCRNAELLKKKEDIQMVSDWLENYDESSILILVSDEISVDAKLEKLVPTSNRQKFWEMFEDKKLPWLLNFFKKNGYSITHEASELVLDLVENNTLALKTECSRFFSIFPKEHQINEDDVESILSHNKEESAFTLFNAIADDAESESVRFEKALSILQKIRLSKENSSVMLIAGLASCFRKLVLWFDKGESAFPGKLMQKQYRKASHIWSKGQATAILANLAQTDMDIRSGGAMFEDVILQKMIYEIVIKKGAKLQVAEYN